MIESTSGPSVDSSEILDQQCWFQSQINLPWVPFGGRRNTWHTEILVSNGRRKNSAVSVNSSLKYIYQYISSSYIYNYIYLLSAYEIMDTCTKSFEYIIYICRNTDGPRNHAFEIDDFAGTSKATVMLPNVPWLKRGMVFHRTSNMWLFPNHEITKSFK